jgi:hypothetical protein
VDDVEEGLVAGPDDAVGEVVRMRVAPLARDRVDRLHLVAAELVQPLVGQRDDLVLAHPRLQHVDDVLVDAVDHRRGLVEQHDLVRRLDDAGVEHGLLGVANRDALPVQLEQERGLDDVEAERGARHPGLRELRLDLGHRVAHQARLGGDRTAEAEEPGPPVLVRQPCRVQLVMPHRRAEVPQNRVPVPEHQGVADHLVAERAADPGLRGVADVVEVEEQERAAVTRLQRRPGPRHPVAAQPGEVDPLLVVDPHVTGGAEGPHACRALCWGHQASS